MINERDYLHEKHIQTDEEEMIVIWHDNGVPGQEGFTDYTLSEVEKEGGIEALKESYKQAGIKIIRIC